MLTDTIRADKARIIFIQPAYAKYRRPLFVRLYNSYTMSFYFIEDAESHLQNKVQNGKRLSMNENLFRTKKRENPGLSIKREKSIIDYLTIVPPRCLKLFFHLLDKKNDIAVTSIANSPQTLTSIFASKLLRKKCVLWVEEWFLPRRRSLKAWFTVSLPILISRWSLNNVDSVVVEGRAQYNYVRAFGIPPEKIFFSNHCSLDLSKMGGADLKKNLGFDNNLVVLFLSRIIRIKGLDILIKAYSRLEHENDSVGLVVCGDGPFRQYCEYLSEDLKLEHIKFQGMVQGEKLIASYYQTADVVVVPSLILSHDNMYCEGWGLTVNEALSMGKPVIVTNAVGSVLDLVKHGTNGYVVQQGCVDDLYFALSKILSNDELRRSMGKESQRIFEEFNDFNKMFEGFKMAFDYALKSNPPAT
jgi:glycosyltransferase involved in cell wall biosynthesis